jgi:hypothetical protein
MPHHRVRLTPRGRGWRAAVACGTVAALTNAGNSGVIPGLARSGVGDERIVGPLSRWKRRLGKEIREVDPKPEYPVVRSSPSRE